MGHCTGDVSGQTVNVELGDITASKSEAYIVPQFDSCASESGVGGALIRSGAGPGMTAYQNYLDAHDGRLAFGDACLTSSGGGHSKYLIHVATVDSGAEEEFATVQKAVLNALSLAYKRGVKTIAAPALGTGALGRLTPAQSAKAMMSAIFQFAKSGGRFDAVNLVIFGSVVAQTEFANVLRSRSYESIAPEPGQKPFNFDGWAAQMQIDSYSGFLLGKRD